MNVIDFLQHGAPIPFSNEDDDEVTPKSATSEDSFGELSALAPVAPPVNNASERTQASNHQGADRFLKSGGGKGSVNLSIQSISQSLQVLPIPQHKCELCPSSFESQFKFFEHLKSHYENVPCTSANSTENKKKKKRLSPKSTRAGVSRVEGLSGSDGKGDLPQIIGQVISKYSNNISKTGFPKNESTELRIEQQSDITPHSIFNKHKTDVKPILQTIKERLSLTCPKCKKPFRKEHNFNLHVDRCQKYSESSKIPIQEVDDTSVLVDKDYDDVFDDDFNPSPLGDNAHTLVDDEEETDMMYQQSSICPSCDEHCETKDNLDKHLLDKHPDLILKKKKAGERRAATKKSDVLKCQQCPKTFNHRNSLIYHMRSHTGERPFKCDTCGKRFFATSALMVHKRLHSGARPYPCDICGRKFRQWGDLKYHKISIHSGEKSYQCEFCGKDFARKYSLTVHRRIHTGERDYKCEFCAKPFRAASYLQNHRRIHTGEKPHKCPTCGKDFRVLSDMKRHMASHNRDPKTRTITVQTVPVSCDNSAGSSGSQLFPVMSSSSHSKIVQVNDNILVQHQQTIPILTAIATNSSVLPPLDVHTSSSNFKTESAEEVCLSGPMSTQNQSAQSQIIASDGTLLPATAYKVTLAGESNVYSTSDLITSTMVSEGMTIYQDTGQNLEVLAEQVTRTNTVVLVPLTHTFIQD